MATSRVRPSQRKSREWDNGVRTCKSCNETKESSEFPLSQHGNPRSVCKACKARYDYYGLTKVQTDKLLEAQDFECLICARDLRVNRFVIDHDHKCCPKVRTCGNCIRGILCTSCNSQLGWMEKFGPKISKYLEAK